ncbi:MAG: sigma-54 dependent transcriptional regulator [Burkholderiales bacterium]
MKKREILVAEDDRILNELIVRELSKIGYAVSGVGDWGQAARYLEKHAPDLILTDVRLPDANMLEHLPALTAEQPVVVLTAFGSVPDAVKAIKAGAAEYLSKPIDLDELELAIERALNNAALSDQCEFLKGQLRDAGQGSMVGRSAAMLGVRQMIEAVAATDATVLIQGESGVGKELVASAVHSRSHRAHSHFVPVDCCTLQPTLFESELFGYERGAFTGADRLKKGLIEGADGGTVFLDEIGEIEAAVQAKLLRVLETQAFRRVGGVKDLRADIRIVAATNRSLEQMTREGKFRSDLFYRLNAFIIDVPPLRSRREDIPDLVGHFLSTHRFSQRVEKTVSSDAMQRLVAYDYPGNVRELRNMVERAIIISGAEPVIRPKHLALGAPAHPHATARSAVSLAFDDEPSLEEIEKAYLRMMLRKYGGHRLKVADVLDVSERSVYRMIEKYGLGDER